MVLGALGWVWEFFATQAPSSPWNVPGLPIAVDHFALRAWIMAFAILAGTPARPHRALFPLASVGCAFWLGAQAVSALTGLLGVQIRDARHASAVVLASGLVGGVLLGIALGIALRQGLRDES